MRLHDAMGLSRPYHWNAIRGVLRPQCLANWRSGRQPCRCVNAGLQLDGPLSSMTTKPHAARFRQEKMATLPGSTDLVEGGICQRSKGTHLIAGHDICYSAPVAHSRNSPTEELYDVEASRLPIGRATSTENAQTSREKPGGRRGQTRRVVHTEHGTVGRAVAVTSLGGGYA